MMKTVTISFETRLPRILVEALLRIIRELDGVDSVKLLSIADTPEPFVYYVSFGTEPGIFPWKTILATPFPVTQVQMSRIWPYSIGKMERIKLEEARNLCCYNDYSVRDIDGEPTTIAEQTAVAELQKKRKGLDYGAALAIVRGN